LVNPAIDCVVTKVNREPGYVILSVGRDEKVHKGMRFILSRDGKYVGEVQVDSVYPKISSAAFVTPNMAPEVGDEAATRL